MIGSFFLPLFRWNCVDSRPEPSTALNGFLRRTSFTLFYFPARPDYRQSHRAIDCRPFEALNKKR